MFAQTLYDLREKYESVSGTDLHEFFTEYVGDPSPSGYEPLDRVDYLAAFKLFADGEITIAWNNGGEFQTAENNIIAIGHELSIPNGDILEKRMEARRLESRYQSF